MDAQLPSNTPTILRDAYDALTELGGRARTEDIAALSASNLRQTGHRLGVLRSRGYVRRERCSNGWVWILVPEPGDA